MPKVTCPSCARTFTVGRLHEAAGWKGGEYLRATGYVEAVVGEEEAALYPTARLANPRRSSSSSVIQRSHLVWNRAHPDDLVQRGEHVHHLNRVRDDDRPENLAKMLPEEHREEHRETNRKAMLAYWDEKGRKHPARPCEHCGEVLPSRQRSIPTARFCSRRCKNDFRRGKPRAGY